MAPNAATTVYMAVTAKIRLEFDGHSTAVRLTKGQDHSDVIIIIEFL